MNNSLLDESFKQVAVNASPVNLMPVGGLLFLLYILLFLIGMQLSEPLSVFLQINPFVFIWISKPLALIVASLLCYFHVGQIRRALSNGTFKQTHFLVFGGCAVVGLLLINHFVIQKMVLDYYRNSTVGRQAVSISQTTWNTCKQLK